MKTTSQKKQKKAFALVMALALMGFMVLLIVSLAAMVGMQLKLSKQAMNSFKAKQAARFSAYQALGQIQSTLGPDQRITANAGIL
jgi:ABC-type lipoprotein release transport system permease subunit